MVSPKSIEPSLSKRVRKALHKLNNGGNADEENMVDETQAKKSKKSNDSKKPKRKERTIKSGVSTCESETFIEADNTLNIPDESIVDNSNTKEYIPQREKDKASALEKKLHAIEIYRKSKRGLAKTKKVKRIVRKVKKEAELSESDSN